MTEAPASRWETAASKLVEPSLALGLGTALLYLSGYSYLEAFYGRYGVPLEALEIDFARILKAGLQPALVIFMLLAYAAYYYATPKESHWAFLPRPEDAIVGAIVLLALAYAAVVPAFWLPERWMFSSNQNYGLLIGLVLFAGYYVWMRFKEHGADENLARLTAYGSRVLVLVVALFGTMLVAAATGHQMADLSRDDQDGVFGVTFTFRDPSHALHGVELRLLAQAKGMYYVLDPTAGSTVHAVPEDEVVDVRLRRL